MRNPNTPVTSEEILAVLREIQQETSDQYIRMERPPGDARGEVITEIIKRVTEKAT